VIDKTDNKGGIAGIDPREAKVTRREGDDCPRRDIAGRWRPARDSGRRAARGVAAKACVKE
jgi:hypothetical protein